MVAPHFVSYEVWKVKRTETDRKQRSERKKEGRNVVNNSCTVAKLGKPQFASTLQCATLHNTPLPCLEPCLIQKTRRHSSLKLTTFIFFIIIITNIIIIITNRTPYVDIISSTFPFGLPFYTRHVSRKQCSHLATNYWFTIKLTSLKKMCKQNPVLVSLMVCI